MKPMLSLRFHDLTQPNSIPKVSLRDEGYSSLIYFNVRLILTEVEF